MCYDVVSCSNRMTRNEIVLETLETICDFWWHYLTEALTKLTSFDLIFMQCLEILLGPKQQSREIHFPKTCMIASHIFLYRNLKFDHWLHAYKAESPNLFKNSCRWPDTSQRAIWYLPQKWIKTQNICRIEQYRDLKFQIQKRGKYKYQ